MQSLSLCAPDPPSRRPPVPNVTRARTCVFPLTLYARYMNEWQFHGNPDPDAGFPVRRASNL
jgi:hypothetical protein